MHPSHATPKSSSNPLRRIREFIAANPQINDYFQNLIKQKAITDREWWLMLIALTPLIQTTPLITVQALDGYMAMAQEQPDFSRITFTHLCQQHAVQKNKNAIDYINATNLFFMSLIEEHFNFQRIAQVLAPLWFGLISIFWDNQNQATPS